VRDAGLLEQCGVQEFLVVLDVRHQHSEDVVGGAGRRNGASTSRAARLQKSRRPRPAGGARDPARSRCCRMQGLPPRPMSSRRCARPGAARHCRRRGTGRGCR
jgi:hypothetical protein